MFRVFGKRSGHGTRREGGAPARLAADVRLYAIGDIHGRLDLLETLLDKIRADRDVYGDATHKLVFLGDYVDRGGQSRAVLERLSAGPIEGFETTYLLGNHEHSMLRFLEDIEVGPAWL